MLRSLSGPNERVWTRRKETSRIQDKRPQTPIGQLWNSIQSWLMPVLEDEIGALDEKHRQFVAVCELCAPQDHMAAYRWCGNAGVRRNASS